MYNPDLTTRERQKQNRREKHRGYAKKCSLGKIVQGLCISCGGEKERSDTRRCNKCSELHNEKSKVRYDGNKASGICTRCGNLIEAPNSKECNTCVERRRSNILKRVYGLTDEEYNALADQQDQVCWICGKRETTRKGRLHVDHDHTTGKVRGLLCGRCNGGLGCFDDSVEALEKAIEYLKASIQD